MRCLRILLCLAFAAMAGCQSTPRHPAYADASAQPAWLLNPQGPEGQFGGVGVSKVHIKGPSFQREVAIARALDELARQAGVQVSSTLQTASQVRGNSSLQSETNIISFQTTTGEVIRTRLRATWVHPKTNELYVWMTKE